MRFMRLFLAALSLALAGSAIAQGYPNRAIRLIVPFSTGTATDILARLVGEKLSASLGQPVVIDNRAGAGGIIGVDACAKASPDGYTLVMAGSGPFAINPSLYLKVPYDSIKDFTPIINMVLTAHVLVTGSDVPARTLQDLVAMAKAKPGSLNFASPGVGATQHLTMEMLRSRLGLDIVHIPYKGSSPAQLDIIGGKVTMMFDTISAVLSQVKNGKLRAIAVSTAARSSFMPDVPTVAESGVPGFDASGWIGIAAPAGTPAPIVTRLNAEILKILGSSEMRDRLNAFAFEPIGDTPEHFRAFIQSEMAKFAKIVKESGAKLE